MLSRAAAPAAVPVTAGNLWDALTSGAAPARGTLHQWADDRFTETRWDDVVREAERMTAGLRRAGVEPGSRVATVLTNTPQAVRGILGTWLAGGTLASFPVPARGMGFDEYVDQLRTLCLHLEPAALLVDEFMLALLPEDLRRLARARSWESVADSGRIDAAPPELDDVAFIQYSSGSTSNPKGCELSARAIFRQLELVAEFLEVEPGNHVHVSWLPLSHDMGVFGNLLAPWAHRYNLVLSSPERFGFSPRTWFNDCATFGGHLVVWHQYGPVPGGPLPSDFQYAEAADPAFRRPRRRAPRVGRRRPGNRGAGAVGSGAGASDAGLRPGRGDARGHHDPGARGAACGRGRRGCPRRRRSAGCRS